MKYVHSKTIDITEEPEELIVPLGTEFLDVQGSVWKNKFDVYLLSPKATHLREALTETWEIMIKRPYEEFHPDFRYGGRVEDLRQVKRFVVYRVKD